MWDINKARSITEFPYTLQLNGVNGILPRIRQFQKWRNGNASALKLLTEPEINDAYHKNLRFLQQVKDDASEFMCGMRNEEDPKQIALLHAITMVNCVFIYLFLFLVFFVLKETCQGNLFALLMIRLCSIILFVALLNCFAFPIPAIRNMPDEFKELCKSLQSASSDLADTFDPYM